MLTEADRKRIEAMVKAAEARTAGEIYCVVAQESSDYRETPVVWGAVAALLAPTLLLAAGIHVTAPELGDHWTAAQMAASAEKAARGAVSGAILLQTLLFIFVTLVVAIPPIRRLLTPRGMKRERVRRRAQEQFMAKNLAATRERTGVLIYISVAERMAELIADEGISARVAPVAWEGAMARLIAGFKLGRPLEGFEQAIDICAEILSEHVPPRPGDNPNELPNTVAVIR
jgi:putative membrane protein